MAADIGTYPCLECGAKEDPIELMKKFIYDLETISLSPNPSVIEFKADKWKKILKTFIDNLPEENKNMKLFKYIEEAEDNE